MKLPNARIAHACSRCTSPATAVSKCDRFRHIVFLGNLRCGTKHCLRHPDKECVAGFLSSLTGLLFILHLAPTDKPAYFIVESIFGQDGNFCQNLLRSSDQKLWLPYHKRNLPPRMQKARFSDVFIDAPAFGIFFPRRVPTGCGPST